MGNGIRRGRVWANGLDKMMSGADYRFMVGLLFLLLGAVMLNTPDIGTIDWLADHGLSPKGYGYFMIAIGGIILRWPRSKAYSFLAATAFAPYIIGTVAYSLTIDNLAPVFIVCALSIFIVFASSGESTRGKDRG